MDVQAVCTGFIYALSVADKFIASGQSKCALVVGAEVFSRLLDWSDRRTCVLFGDGAGAVVLKPSDTPGILSTHLHADGSQSGILNVDGSVQNGIVQGRAFVHMRSEEHTSELQSLMRISYAVFCLNKKKNKNNE